MHTYITSNNCRVNLSPKTREHLEAHLDVLPYLTPAIARIDLQEKRHTEIAVDMGEIIGEQLCVPATEIGLDDEAQFVLRKGRLGATRTIRDGAPIATSMVSLVLAPDRYDRTAWRLVTAWIGRLAAPEPWDPRLTDATRPGALAFWFRHALIVRPDQAAGQPFMSNWRAEIAAAERRRN